MINYQIIMKFENINNFNDNNFIDKSQKKPAAVSIINNRFD